MGFFIIIKTFEEALTMLCSIVKHTGSGRALKSWGKTLDCISCFALHFFHALHFLRALQVTEQSTVEASLFVNYVFYMYYVSLNKPIILNVRWTYKNYASRMSFWSKQLR